MSDLKTVFKRTAQGEQKLLSPQSGLSPAFMTLLKAVDGQISGEKMLAKFSKLTGDDLSEWLAHLERQGLIESVNSNAEENLDFTAMFNKAPPTVNLSAADKARIATEAKSGSDELTKTGSFLAIKAPAGFGAPSGLRAASDITILMVEDDDTQALFVQKLLMAAGFKQHRAASKEEIVAELNRQPAPDCILMDVELPGLSGFDVLARIRQHPRLKTVPVIMITAHATHEFVMKGLSLGANGYLAKPVKKQILLDSLAQILKVALPPA
jgi:two-component system, OmpR family, response regulator